MNLKRHLWILVALALGTGAVSAKAETITVTIEKMVFSPAEITVRSGDTVEWINNDILAHTATVKGSWEVMIPAKKAASTILNDIGALNYYCRFHPNMMGKIAVTAHE
ncbi:MAG: cupredoxin family copper-binding protein [Aestuariivirga sp.]